MMIEIHNPKRKETLNDFNCCKFLNVIYCSGGFLQWIWNNWTQIEYGSWILNGASCDLHHIQMLNEFINCFDESSFSQQRHIAKKSQTIWNQLDPNQS